MLGKYYLLQFLVLTFVLASNGSRLIFVKTVNNTSDCPSSSDPCLTLTEYLELGNDAFSSFIFLDGYHILDTDFTMTDLVNVSLRADSNASVSIDCGGQTRFLFNNVSGLVIENIAFISCGISSMTEPLPGNSLYNLDQAELVNITITNSSSGALYIQGSNVTIMNILIEKNQASFTESSFSGMKAEHSAIYMYGNNTFSQNLALIYGIHPLSTSSCFEIADIQNQGFVRNRMGPTLFGVNTTVHSYGTLAFIDNTSPSGIMSLQESSLVMNGRSVFSKNRVCFLGALAFTETDAKLSGEIIFSYNSAEFYSACLSLNHSSLDVAGNINFLDNSAFSITSIVANASNIFIIGSLTNNNNTVIANPPGFESIPLYKAGILLLSNSHMVVNGTAELMNNHVDNGVIQIDRSSLTAKNTSFINNVAVRGSCCVLVFNGGVQYSGDTLFSYNTGSRSALFSQGSRVVIEGTIKFFQNVIQDDPNSNLPAGSIGMYSGQLVLQGEYVFENNEANNGLGGAIHALYSTLHFEGNGQFTNNTARDGGAIALLSCPVTFKGNATFTNNTARLGGAVYLVSSNITVEPQTLLEFESNFASQGGAIYVQVIEFGTEDTKLLENFSLQFLPPICFLDLNETSNISFRFQNNTATDGGSALYGGRLDNCRLANQPDRSALEIFRIVSVFEDSNTSPMISSQPQRFCFCANNIPNCALSTNIVSVFRGQRFSVRAIAFSQTNSSIKGSVRSQLKSLPGNEMRSLNGNLQKLENRCTDLNYTLYSENQQEEVLMYANGVQGNDESTVLTLLVTFEDCPEGFVLVSDRCVCDERITEYGGTCNVEVGKITKAQNIWIGTHKDGNNSYVGLILNRHCPFDYCIPPPVEFELSEPDSQCNHNRSGFLCGACKGNLSLVFGSSKCMECLNDYLALLIPFALLGVLLVFVLFLLHLTIAHGTLHGLILYANIVNINQSVFGLQDVYFPFIAWLNLDFGFETCFYDGMDQLAKTGLQFVFPFYLLLLVGLIIVVCHCSIRVSTLFVNMNPAAVLATIILLSYNKILQITVEIFSYSVLDYPDNVTHKVWNYDGNVEQFTANTLGSWHALFTIALFLIVFLQVLYMYPFVLTIIQLLQKVPQISDCFDRLCAHFTKLKSCFNWINVRLNPFINAYHAPYKASSRYWIGLCLFLRLVLLIVSATAEETSANLLTISTFCLVLMSIIGTTRGVYTNRWLDILEISFILNLGLFSAATYHNQRTEGNQTVTAYLSIIVAFITFLGIVLYHSYQRLMKITRFKKMVKVIKVKVRETLKKTPQDREIEENNDQPIQSRNGVTSQDLVMNSDGEFELTRETLLEEN